MTGPSSTHWLDRVYSTLTARGRLFARGFGGLETLAPLREAFLSPGPPSPIAVEIGPERRRAGIRLHEGRFVSPCAKWLPAESRTARFELLLPTGPEAAPVCVFLASTGEQGFGWRKRLCVPLVLEGLGALLLEVPYYGRRQAAGQHGWLLGSVADQLAMGLGTIEEGRSLLAWLRARGHPRVGVAGYSMGGSMAGYVAARTPFAVSAAVLAAGDSAAPIFSEGLMSERVDWTALGGGEGEGAARRKVAEIFDLVSLARLSPPVSPAHALIVGCREDGFIDPESVRRLHRHWPGSELRWLAGGHVTGLLGHGKALRQAIRDSFLAKAMPG